MKSRLLSGLLLSCALFVQSALAQRMPVPIVNYRNIPLDASGASVRAERVEQAIRNAASAKGWKIAEEPGNKMLVTLVVNNKHTVMVEIAYSETRYSLVYRDSVNMKYDPEYLPNFQSPAGRSVGINARGRPSIHPNYNVWVGDLKVAIGAELSRVPAEDKGAAGPARVAATADSPKVVAHERPPPQATNFARLEDALAPPTLGEVGQRAYRAFLASRKPRAFALSASADYSWRSGVPEAMREALLKCELAAGATCWLYAVDDAVVWIPEPQSREPIALAAADRPANREPACDPSRTDPRLCDVAAVPVRSEGKARYRAFLATKERPRAFVVSANGNWRMHWGPNAAARALEDCQKTFSGCHIYAEDDRVVWNPQSSNQK
jgi:hypothetical protein